MAPADPDMLDPKPGALHPEPCQDDDLTGQSCDQKDSGTWKDQNVDMKLG